MILVKPNDQHIDAMIQKRINGKTFYQFKFLLISIIVLGMVSLILNFMTTVFNWSAIYSWLSAMVGFISILLLLPIWKKVQIFEQEEKARCQKIFEENIID